VSSIDEQIKHKDEVYLKACSMLPRLERARDAAIREYDATLKFARQKEAELAHLWAKKRHLEAQA
jgi:hypothetical protein